MAPGNLLSMRAFIMRKASDSGELSGAAVDTRISVWASAKGAKLVTANAAAAARIKRFMVFSPQLIGISKTIHQATAWIQGRRNQVTPAL
jgi:hypothetical protein